MLKFTNTGKTSAQFNGASFSLSAPEDWDSIGDGPTRDDVLEWLSAGNTPAPADSPLEPTASELALVQIRALEAPFEDDIKKMQRQMMISQLLKEAMAAYPQLTKAQVHAALMSQANGSGSGYAKLVTLEAAVVPFREIIRQSTAT